MKTKTKNRMYKNPIMEILSKSGPIMMSIYHLLVISIMFNYGYSLNYGAQTTGMILLIFAAGFFTWSFGEYMLHRFLFHIEGESRFIKAFHYAMHGYHHEYPNDINRLFMPPAPVTIFIVTFFGIFYLLMGSYTWYFLPGFEFGYFVYSLIHYAIHHKGLSGYFKKLGHHHILHHYKTPDKAYGVSTKVWDRVFKSMPLDK